MRAVGLVEVLTALRALFKKRTGAFVAGFSFCKRGLQLRVFAAADFSLASKGAGSIW